MPRSNDEHPYFEERYNRLVADIIHNGERRQGRNGNTRALFAKHLTVDTLLGGEFPLLTQRQIFYKGVFGELAAFVRGATTIGEFKRWGCNYWDDNAIAWPVNIGLPLNEMSIGDIYGKQWVNFANTGFNQLTDLINRLKHDPYSRRHVITAFNPAAEACLPPCHLTAQFYVDDNRLNCQVYMRSVDVILGLPSDIVLYAAMLVQVAGEVNRQPGELTFIFGDTHIYENHVDLFMDKHLYCESFGQPAFRVDKFDIRNFEPSFITILDYQHAGPMKYAMNV